MAQSLLPKRDVNAGSRGSEIFKVKLQVLSWLCRQETGKRTWLGKTVLFHDGKTILSCLI